MVPKHIGTFFLTCICLQSCPRAGNVMRLNVIGHTNPTLMAVCSRTSSPVRLFIACMLQLFAVSAKLRLTEVRMRRSDIYAFELILNCQRHN